MTQDELEKELLAQANEQILVLSSCFNNQNGQLALNLLKELTFSNLTMDNIYEMSKDDNGKINENLVHFYLGKRSIYERIIETIELGKK